ncbi:uncharacterized protein [Aegilops tauschii subsp. strangulata]|uniref:uncharacterized protein n=1 Tax=Aegilops tauschii subsp. strangulata TaxID=200361 RepID=UPI003CC893FC
MEERQHGTTSAAALWGHAHLPPLAPELDPGRSYPLPFLSSFRAVARAKCRDIYLIRRCVYETIAKDEIPRLFPPEVPQRLLTLLLRKFQRIRSYRADQRPGAAFIYLFHLKTTQLIQWQLS